MSFCTKHGYVQCHCPESMLMSLAKFEAMEECLKEARVLAKLDELFMDGKCHIRERDLAIDNLKESLKNLDSLENPQGGGNALPLLV